MRKFTKPVIDYLVYLAVRIVVCIIQTLPLSACQTFARWVGVIATDVIPIRRGVIDENLQHAFGHLSSRQRRRLKKKMWEHLILMVCEVAHAPRKIHRTNWRKYVRLRNGRPLVRQLLDDRPTILVSGHYGNFEIAGFMTGMWGFPSYTIARPLDNPYLDAFVNRFRGLHGQFILPKEGSARQVEAVLNSGGTIALLGDQHAGPKGCWVEFLGRMASCHKAVAVFTIAAGAPMAVGYARRLDAPLHFEVGMEDLADPALPGPAQQGVKPLTQWYNRMLERVILAGPEQYWWLHRRWRDQPPAKARSIRSQAA